MEYSQYMKDEVQAMKDYARDHYDEGGHWVYETHDDKDYEEMLLASGSLEDAKRNLREFWLLKQEMYEDVQGF
jgi:hypothetical protein